MGLYLLQSGVLSVPKDPCVNKGFVPGVEQVGPSERSLVKRDVTSEEMVDPGVFLFVSRAC